MDEKTIWKSVRQLMLGPEAIGVDNYNKVLILDKLMDSKPLFLTANTSTLYSIPSLNMKKTGPMVRDVPAGMLGAFNDARFRYMQDIGPFGPDQGKGGKYLVIPPDYEGYIPEGYFIVHSKTYRVWIFMRAFIENGLEAAVKNVEDNLKIYPLNQKDTPLPMEFISGTGKSFNTIHDNDLNFYHHVNEVIQEESLEMIDPETRGLLASIGIENGKSFNPDERMLIPAKVTHLDFRISQDKAMKPEDLANYFWKEFEKGKDEITPGDSKTLKIMSRLPPSFIFKQVNK